MVELVCFFEDNFFLYFVAIPTETIPGPENYESRNEEENWSENKQFLEVFVAWITTSERIWSWAVDKVDKGPSYDIEYDTSYKIACR